MSSANNDAAGFEKNDIREPDFDYDDTFADLHETYLVGQIAFFQDGIGYNFQIF